jgi:hypothetical protein
MTKLMVVVGAAVAVLLLDAAPAFAHYYGGYRAYGYRAFGFRPLAYRAYGYYGRGYRAYGYYGGGYRAYAVYGGWRPYRFIPAEQRHWWDRNTSAFNS